MKLVAGIILFLCSIPIRLVVCLFLIVVFVIEVGVQVGECLEAVVHNREPARTGFEGTQEALCWIFSAYPWDKS